MTGFASPAINNHVGGWNQNPTWEHFSSLVEATTEGLAAPNSTIRHRHVKAALYAAIGALESFLNTTMRAHLKEQGLEEAAIIDRLRKPAFAVKLKKWPTEFAPGAAATPDDALAAIFGYQKLRDEVTHPKGDHSLYRQLDAVDLDAMRPIVAEFMVRALQGRQETFPYWLLGWNFVGMNGDHRWPLLINNSQLLFSLRALGFDVPVYIAGPMEEWEQHFMTTIDGYRALDEALRKVNHCEPQGRLFNRAPRLCRRWWDLNHVATCGNRTAPEA